jgi:hypothetical protein
VSDREES